MSHARTFRAAAIVAVLFIAANSAYAQQDTPASPLTESASPSLAAPTYGPGEKLLYNLAVGGAKVGTGSLAIQDTLTIDGHMTYHSVFSITGGLLFIKVNDRLESWFEPGSATTHRFYQHLNEASYHAERFFDFYPERARMHQRGVEERESVHEPLDDLSFFYFVRSVPLKIGETYTFSRYFRPDNNPVIVKVLRKERLKLEAGTFDTIVLQPIIKSGGLFAQGGEALIWVTDDDRRLMVRLKAKMPVLQSLELYLKSYTPPTIPPG
jgi:hypothetical protein